MNFDFLREKITEKYEKIQLFADAIGVARGTVSSWLNGKSNPEEFRHLAIINALDLSEDEIGTFMGTPATSIVFRKVGGSSSDQDIHKRSKEFAETFFKIDGSSYVTSGTFFSIAKQQTNHTEVANYIRGFLDIEKNEPAKLSDILNQLNKHNVNVFFVPFSKIGITIPHKNTSNREVAFTAKKGNRTIIFVDTDRTMDETNFDICHELTHIALGHTVTTDEEEKFCNKVAQELVYPIAFFKEKEDVIAPFLDASEYSWMYSVNSFKELCQEFDWSPKGLALALSDHGYIKKDSHEYLRLMKIGSSLKGLNKTIDEIHFKEFKTQEFDDVVKFFEEEIYKSKNLYKPFIEIKNAASSGRLSPRRLAEILNIDSGDADELTRFWISEQGTEESQDVVESATVF